MKIRFTPAALDDLVQIRDYLVEHLGEARAIRASIDLLIPFPYTGHIGKVPGTRVRKVTGQPYVVIYRVTNDAIEIAHIYHERQNWR